MPIPPSSLISQVVELSTESDELDFENLRSFAIELVQKYSGSVWTDYNLHDPGVTILEALCFALTDLVYRTSFPISDILTNQNGYIDYKDQSFYTIDQILATNPANLNDLKKVILDQLDDIQYIDFKKCNNITFSISNRGVYDAYIQISQNKFEKISSIKDNAKQEIEYSIISNKIKETFFNYRYLGIDLDQVYFLKPKELNVIANILISKEIDPEEILAKVYFEINNYFSHIIKFESPVDLYNNSIDLVDIYDGPTLKKGIIRKHSFQPQIAEANKSDLITIIKTIAGIKEVIHFSFTDLIENQNNFTIKLLENEYFTINHANVNNQIKLRTDEQEIKINKIFFENVYQEMISASRLPNEREIEEITNKNLKGRYRSIDVYHTIQNHFPVIYGLGLEGIAKSEGEERLANLKQLKAFLSFFEQMMANYLSQLNATSQIFSNKINIEEAKTYYSQSIHNITGLKEVLTFFNDINNANGEVTTEFSALNQLIKSLDEISESDTKFNDRKNAFLDHLLARFNISLNSFPVELYEQYYGNKSINRVSNTLYWKSNILQNIHNITSNRFKAPLYNESKSEYNFLSIIYNFLFIQNKPFSSLTKHFNEKINNVTLKNNDEIEIITNQKFVLVEEVIPVIDNKSLIQLKEKKLDDDFIIFEFQDEQVFVDACNKNNYKIITDVFGRDSLLILFKSKNNENWRVISRVVSDELANIRINLIIEFFLSLNKLSEGIHMIENVQLRPKESFKIFGFQIIDNVSNKVILKSLETRNKIENDIYLAEFKNLVLNINDDNYIEIINKLASKYILYDIIESNEIWFEIFKEIGALFNDELSDYRIQYFVNIHNQNINLDFFDYKINFIIPSWPSRFQDLNFKKYLEEIIIEHLPANLIPRFLYLDLEQVTNFEKIYYEWASHITNKETIEFQNSTFLLTHFLNSL